jgi:hypothetical protein
MFCMVMINMHMLVQSDQHNQDKKRKCYNISKSLAMQCDKGNITEVLNDKGHSFTIEL